jgi:hypothetical protein
MAQNEDILEGLFKNTKISIYDATDSAKDNRKNTGYDFSEDLMRKNLSPLLFKNEYLANFINLIQLPIIRFINTVTTLRVYKSYTVKKDYTKVR